MTTNTAPAPAGDTIAPNTVPDHLADEFNRIADQGFELLEQVEQFAKDSDAAVSRFNALPWSDDRNGDQAMTDLMGPTGFDRMQAVHTVLAHLLWWTEPMGGTPSAEFIERHTITAPMFWELWRAHEREHRMQVAKNLAGRTA